VVRDDDVVAVENTPPSGTVTFLFTDIEGSTELWDREPVAMQAALVDHDRLVREALTDRAGYVFAATGDGFGAAFDDPSDAVSAAATVHRKLAAHEWGLAEGSLRARVGVHSGVAFEREGNYFGPVVNEVARIMAVAAAGQVLVSAATAGLVRQDVGVGLRFVGERSLKGVSQPVGLCVAVGDGLVDAANQPIDHGSAQGRPLPSYATTFVGREAEIASIVEQLSEPGLVTVVGPGGMGKTRLAIEAARIAESTGRSVWFVDLIGLMDAEASEYAVATAVGASASRSGEVFASIIDRLRTESGVLILDNCEQLVAEVAEIVTRLAVKCPLVTTLATSRAPLGVASERLVQLDPLDTDGAAVTLLKERAAVWGDEGGSQGDLEDLCRALDGMPLAIELAAAQSRFLSPAELLEQLDDRYDVLSTTVVGGPDRHRSVEALVASSFEAVKPDAQRLLCLLSVCSTAVELDLIASIWAASGETTRVTGPLAALVDASLVMVDREGERTRFKLLETIRAFGKHELEVRDAPIPARVAHATAIAARVQVDLDAFEAPGSRDILPKTVQLWPEIRTAVGAAAELGLADLACALVWRIGAISQALDTAEAGEWVDDVLRIEAITQDPRILGVYASGAVCNWTAGRFEIGEQRWQLVRQGLTPETPWNATIEQLSGLHALIRSEFDLAIEEKLASLEQAVLRNDEFARIQGTLMLGMYQAQAGYSEDAQATWTAIAAAAHRYDNFYTTILTRFAECQIWLDTDPQRAFTAGEQAIATATDQGYQWTIGTAHNYVAAAFVRVGDPAEALLAIKEPLDRIRDGGSVQSLANTVRNAVVLLDRQDRTELAAPLVGWLTTARAGIPGTPGMREHPVALKQQLATRLGSDSATDLLHQGEQATTADIIELTYSALNTLAPTVSRGGGTQGTNHN